MKSRRFVEVNLAAAHLVGARLTVRNGEPGASATRDREIGGRQSSSRNHKLGLNLRIL